MKIILRFKKGTVETLDVSSDVITMGAVMKKEPHPSHKNRCFVYSASATEANVRATEGRMCMGTPIFVEVDYMQLSEG